MPVRQSSGSSLAKRLLAILVLAVAVWVLLKLAIGFLATISTLVVVVLAAIAVVWAIRVL